MAHQSSKARAFVTSFSTDAPPETVDIRDPLDTLPSDEQPPGVDEEKEPQSLEEALLGE